METAKLWHTIDERPKDFCEILMYDSKQDVLCLCDYSPVWDSVSCNEAPDGDSWNWGDHYTSYDMWCYADDIKPNKIS